MGKGGARRTLALAFVLAVAVALAGCAGVTGPQVHIKGKVFGDAVALSDSSSVPVSARVTCNGKSVTATKDGTFDLSVTRAKQYDCTADGAPTYATQKAAISGGLGDLMQLNFQNPSQDSCSSFGGMADVECPTLAVKSGTVHGTVTYDNGAPVPGGRVACANTGAVAAGLTPKFYWPDTQTDANGAFNVQPRRPGSLACVAYAPSGAAVRKDVAVEPGKDVQLDFQVCDKPCAPVHYHGGPVMHAVNAYLIFWLPAGRTYEPNGSDAAFEGLMQRYFRDVNGSPLAAMMGQYFDYQGAAGGPIALGGVWQDPGAYQHCQLGGVGCTPARATKADPLTDVDIQAEVLRATRANPGWTAASTNLFFVFTGAGAEECQQDGSQWCTFGDSSHSFCGYHSSFNIAGAPFPAVYAYIPSVTNGDGAGRCNLPSYITGPNGDNVADATLDIVSHEHFEAETDPDTTSGWFDDSAALKREGEVGDKCESALGALGPDNGNITLNGNRYLLQKEWSNRTNGCSFG